MITRSFETNFAPFPSVAFSLADGDGVRAYGSSLKFRDFVSMALSAASISERDRFAVVSGETAGASGPKMQNRAKHGRIENP